MRTPNVEQRQPPSPRRIRRFRERRERDHSRTRWPAGRPRERAQASCCSGGIGDGPGTSSPASCSTAGIAYRPDIQLSRSMRLQRSLQNGLYRLWSAGLEQMGQFIRWLVRGRSPGSSDPGGWGTGAWRLPERPVPARRKRRRPGRSRGRRRCGHGGFRRSGGARRCRR